MRSGWLMFILVLVLVLVPMVEAIEFSGCNSYFSSATCISHSECFWRYGNLGVGSCLTKAGTPASISVSCPSVVSVNQTFECTLSGENVRLNNAEIAIFANPLEIHGTPSISSMQWYSAQNPFYTLLSDRLSIVSLADYQPVLNDRIASPYFGPIMRFKIALSRNVNRISVSVTGSDLQLDTSSGPITVQQGSIPITFPCYNSWNRPVSLAQVSTLNPIYCSVVFTNDYFGKNLRMSFGISSAGLAPSYINPDTSADFVHYYTTGKPGVDINDNLVITNLDVPFGQPITITSSDRIPKGAVLSMGMLYTRTGSITPTLSTLSSSGPPFRLTGSPIMVNYFLGGGCQPRGRELVLEGAHPGQVVCGLMNGQQGWISKIGSYCVDNNNCGDTGRCQQGVCKVASGSSCVRDLDCMSGDACESNSCSFVRLNAPCTVAGKTVITPIFGTLKCVLREGNLRWLGVLSTGCDGDASCDTGLFCSNSRCAPVAVGAPCVTLGAFQGRIPSYDVATSFICSTVPGSSPLREEVRLKSNSPCRLDSECVYGDVCDGGRCRFVSPGRDCFIEGRELFQSGRLYRCVLEEDGLSWKSVPGNVCAADGDCDSDVSLFCSVGRCAVMDSGLPCFAAGTRFVEGSSDPYRCISIDGTNAAGSYRLSVTNGGACDAHSECMSGQCNGGFCSRFEIFHTCYQLHSTWTQDSRTLVCEQTSQLIPAFIWKVPEGGRCQGDDGLSYPNRCAAENSRCVDGRCLAEGELCSVLNSQINGDVNSLVCKIVGDHLEWVLEGVVVQGECLLGDYTGDGRVSIQDFRGFRSHVLSWSDLSSNVDCGAGGQQSCAVRGQFQCDSGLGFGGAVSQCGAHCNIGDFDSNGRVSIQDFRGFRNAVLVR